MFISTEFSTNDDDAIKDIKFQNPKSFRKKIYEFEFNKTGLKHHLPNHGITIIPMDAVDGRAILRIGVYYVDSFQFPAGHRLVSDVFWMIAALLYTKRLLFNYIHTTLCND